MNIHRLFHNLQYPCDCPLTHVIASLDTCKAFDSVEWSNLFQVLQLYGFGPRVIARNRLLYTAPVARISLNSHVTVPLPTHQGTRQGCSLSPVLFALAMEPLAMRIRISTLIRGLPIGIMEERISLYADDTSVYLADPQNSLSSLLQEITTFRDYSGFRVNWDKSILFPLDQAAISLIHPDSRLQVISSFRYSI